MERFQLELIYLYFSPSFHQTVVSALCLVGVEVTSTPTRPVDNVVIATKGLQDRNINIIAGTTVENKCKLILTPKEVQSTNLKLKVMQNLKMMV